jgi:WD40 repeat protein
VNLHGPVRADEGVGLGQAAVKLSLYWEGVAVASTTHTLSLRDATGGKPLPVSRRLLRSLPHPDRTACFWQVAFMPGGHLFTAGSPLGVIQVWDPASGKEVRRIEPARGHDGSADYPRTPDDFSRLYVPITERKVRRDGDDPKAPLRIEFDGRLLVWDVATGKELPPIRPRPGWGVMAAELSPDGKRLISVECMGYVRGKELPEYQIRLIDLATGRSRPVGKGFGTAAFSRDGRRIYLARSLDGKDKVSTLVVLDGDGKELATLARSRGGRLLWPILSPDEKRLGIKAGKGRTNESETLKVFDTATGKEVAAFPSGGNYAFLKPAFSPDGTLLAASDHNAQVTVWDVSRKAVLRQQKFEGKALGFLLAFSPDGKRLAVPARVMTKDDRGRYRDPLDLPQPRVYLFDLGQEGRVEEIVCPHGWSGAAAFSADGKVLAVGGAGAVHLFDVASGAAERSER